jgi:hypothetical protein
MRGVIVRATSAVLPFVFLKQADKYTVTSRMTATAVGTAVQSDGPSGIGRAEYLGLFVVS